MKLLHLIKFSKHLSKLPRPSKFTRTGNQWFHTLISLSEQKCYSICANYSSEIHSVLILAQK